MKELWQKYKHIVVLSYFFLYIAWFLYLESTVKVNYTSIHIKLDDMIPFNEFFLIPYALWFAYIALTIIYFFFHSKDDYFKCCAFLFTGMTICLIIYTIWPNGQNLRPTTFERDNILVYLVKKLYQTDTSTNVCPSIHVFNSIGAHISIIHSERLKKHKIVKTISFLLMILICLSTVFLKQHSVLDGICAVILCMVMYLLIYVPDYEKIKKRHKDKKELLQNNI